MPTLNLISTRKMITKQTDHQLVAPQAMQLDILSCTWWKMTDHLGQEQTYEQIINKRITPFKTKYKVRWKGFTKKYDQRINEKDINAPKLITRYEWMKNYNNIQHFEKGKK